MKTKRYEGGDLRRVLIGMVTDQTVCARIASQWTPDGLFDAPWANMIGGWCVNHLKQYGEPPNGQLEDMFRNWASSADRPEETVRPVERFLQVLSDEHAAQPPPSPDYVLDRAGHYFNKVRIRTLLEEVEDDLDRNQVEAAYGRLVRSSKLEMGTGALTKPGEDFDAWQDAFDEDRQKPLLSYPDRLDWFLGCHMVRGRLISFMGPDKVGKSMWLLDAAYRGIRSRRRVAFFDTGDMERSDVLLRLGARAARIPFEGKPRIRVPKSVDWEGNVEWETKEFDGLLKVGRAFEAFKKACRKQDLFRLCCYPNSSISVDGLSSTLQDWAREGWVADIVVVDYADILAPPNGIRETLDQIDGTWKMLRRMSQELHCLVITATQSSALAYNGKAKVLGRQHFSGRKTKLAHVNGMIGLNVSQEDKEKGITRLNWVVRRHGRYSERRAEVAAGCFDIANPAMRGRKS